MDSGHDPSLVAKAVRNAIEPEQRPAIIKAIGIELSAAAVSGHPVGPTARGGMEAEGLSGYPGLGEAGKAEIWFGDESGLRSDYHAGTTWGVKGQTPIVPHTGNRFSLNMLSMVNARGQMRFMVQEGSVNAAVFIEFLKRLVYRAPHPIFLVLDGHLAHKARLVRDYANSLEGKLRLFFLPPYSPKLNPDEQVWNHVNHHGVGRMFVHGKQQLRIVIEAKLRSLQKSRWLVHSFFLLPDTQYAFG